MKKDAIAANPQTTGAAPITTRIIKAARDGWSNLITGLGGAKDKSKYTKHKLDIILPDDELESIYIGDGLGTRIVDLLPQDMFREGWEYSFPDMDEIQAKKIQDIYKEVMEYIQANTKIKDGICWARLYGGAVIVIGALDGKSLDKPLVPGDIRSFDNLRIIDRSDITFDKIKFQSDPMKERYGLPEYYPISFSINETVKDVRDVHFSRVIEIHGRTIPTGANSLQREQRYWGVSVIQNAYDHLQTLGGAIGSVAALLHDVSIGKYKFKNLASVLALKDGADLIRRRVETMDLTKSAFQSVYIDAEEDFVRENLSFTGIPDVLYIIFMLVSADTGYPITRLFGVSPGGMNATGESDMRNYYDIVRSAQKTMLEPIILRLVKIIAEWKNIEEPYIEFNPLQQMSEKEKADLEKAETEKEKMVADTWHSYINDGVVENYEARFMQFGDSLDDIEPPEDELPPVETLPPVPPPPPVPGQGQAPAAQGSDNPAPENNAGDDPDNKNADPDNKTPPDDNKAGEENNEPEPKEDPPEDEPEDDPDKKGNGKKKGKGK